MAKLRSTRYRDPSTTSPVLSDGQYDGEIRVTALSRLAIQLVEFSHKCWPWGSKLWHSRKRVIPTYYIACGIQSKVFTLSIRTVKLPQKCYPNMLHNLCNSVRNVDLGQPNCGIPIKVLSKLAIQIVVSSHECWPWATKLWNSNKSVIPACYTIVVLMHECWPWNSGTPKYAAWLEEGEETE